MKKIAAIIICLALLQIFTENSAANVINIQNNNIGLNFADDTFGFNMGTSYLYSVPSEPLTFDYPGTSELLDPLCLSTTHSVINVDGNLYDFYDCPVVGTVTSGSNYVSVTKQAAGGDIQVNLMMSLVNNPAINSPVDTVKIKYTLTNYSAVAHTVGVRLELDTKVLDQDGAIISTDNGITTLATTTAWYKSLGQIPANWWDFNSSPYSIPPPELVGRGYTYNNPYDEAATMPDIMEVANWEMVNGDAQWSGETIGDGLSGPDDSAVVFWWCNGDGDLSSGFTLNPGASISFVTYYGLNEQALLTTPTITPTYSQTFTRTPTFTITRTPTITSTWTGTFTFTPSFTQTYTPTITNTFTNSPTFTITATVTPTSTETPTFTITNTFTVTPTVTPTYTVTETFTQTPTPTITPTFTPTPPPFRLIGKGNFPNPFVSDTYLVYWLSTPAQTVKLMVYTVSGEKVFWDDTLTGTAGYNSYHWTGVNRALKPIASGVFIYRIDAYDDNGNHADVIQKLVCVK